MSKRQENKKEPCCTKTSETKATKSSAKACGGNKKNCN